MRDNMKNDNPTNKELAIILEYLKGSLEDLHKKADYTNGNVRMLLEYKAGTQEDVKKIQGMEKDIQQAKGAINLLKVIGITGIAGIITGVVNTWK
jgi:hypothetical protein